MWCWRLLRSSGWGGGIPGGVEGGAVESSTYPPYPRVWGPAERGVRQSVGTVGTWPGAWTRRAARSRTCAANVAPPTQWRTTIPATSSAPTAVSSSAASSTRARSGALSRTTRGRTRAVSGRHATTCCRRVERCRPPSCTRRRTARPAATRPSGRSALRSRPPLTSTCSRPSSGYGSWRSGSTFPTQSAAGQRRFTSSCTRPSSSTAGTGRGCWRRRCSLPAASSRCRAPSRISAAR